MLLSPIDRFRGSRSSISSNDSVAVTSGTVDSSASPTLAVPVTHVDGRIGIIECGPPLEARLRPEDHHLLDLLARQAALSAHNIALARDLAGQVETVHAQAAELSASRARIVEAQESERRRLERNLHDGAQQELVAIMAKVRVVRDLLERDRAAADDMLEDVGRDARNALVGIREIAQGLHPSRVDDRDELLRALREVVAGRSVIDGDVVEALVGSRRRATTSPISRLTPRELDVLRAMAEGRTNGAIAESLNLSGSAIEKYISGIFSKLDLPPEAQIHRRVSAVVAYLRSTADSF
jgi:DNA-binding NarL/FixJ family response regulator